MTVEVVERLLRRCVEMAQALYGSEAEICIAKGVLSGESDVEFSVFVSADQVASPDSEDSMAGTHKSLGLAINSLHDKLTRTCQAKSNHLAKFAAWPAEE